MNTPESYTVVCASLSDMENLPSEMVMVYSVRFGDFFPSRDLAESFANEMNRKDSFWFHYALTADEAKKVLAECETFQVSQ